MPLSLTSGGATASSGIAVANISFSPSSPLSVGSLVLVGLAASNATSAPAFAVTDNLGNTYTSTGARVVQNLETVELFRCVVAFGGTVTITGAVSTNSELTIAAFQFTPSAPGTVFAFNTFVINAGNSSAANVLGLVPFKPPDLAVAVLGAKPSAPQTITGNQVGSWTNAYHQNPTSASGFIFDYNLAQSSTSDAKWGIPTADNWAALIANFTFLAGPVANITYHRIDIPKGDLPIAFLQPLVKQAIPSFQTPVPTRQPNQYRPDPIPDFTVYITPDIKVLPPPVLPPPIFPQQSQRIEPLPVLDSWWEQFRLQPLFTFLPTPFPRQDDQRFDALPDLFPYWEQFLRLSPPTFLPTPFPQQRSQRFDALPDYTSWWEQFTRQPIPITFLPAPFPQQGSQRFDALPDFNSWWEQFRFQPVPVTFLPTPFPQQGSQRYDALPDFNLSWWEQFKFFTVGTGAVVDRPATRQASQRFDPLPVLDSWWEQFRRQPQPITFVLSPFLRQKDQRFNPLPDLNSLWWQQHAYVFQHILPVINPPPLTKPLFVYFEPANNFFGWWEQALVHQFPLLPPSPRLLRFTEFVNRVPDATTVDGKRRLDRFTQIISQAFNYLQQIGRLRITGLGAWDIVGTGAFAAPTSPTVFDDVRFGYTPGALWMNTLTGALYYNFSNAPGAAVWLLVGAGTGLTGTFP